MNRVTTHHFEPYPAYKESGVEWLEEVPAHWDVQRLKSWLDINQMVLAEDTDPNHEFGYLDIGSVEAGQLTSRPQRMRFRSSPSRARRIVRHSDTLVSTVRTYLKAVWYVQDLGLNLIASTGFAVLTPRRDTVPKFVSYVCRSEPFIERVTAASVGIAYPAITETKLATFEVAVPPYWEQTAIVCFLDHTDWRIRRYIRAKEKLITLLKEQKQAIIHEAVTGQIDVRTGQPYSAYKESGVEWLGNVPTHWEVKRLKTDVLNVAEQTTDRNSNEMYIALEHVESWTGKIIDEGADTPFDSLVKRFQAGDVIFGKLRPYLAKVARPSRAGCCVGEFFVLRPGNGKQTAAYLEQFLRSKPIVDAIDASTFGAKMPRADWHFVGNMSVVLPPVPEQITIVRFLDKTAENIDTAISHAEQEIDLLTEYRTRLIADVVTGKLDVREVAAKLPDADHLSDDAVENARDVDGPPESGNTAESAEVTD